MKFKKRLEDFARIELNTNENKSKKQNVVAIVFDKQGKILCIGTNSFVKSNGTQAALAKKAGYESRCYLHAEISALLRWRRFTNDPPYGIFVARLDKAGNFALAAPCEVCSLAIKELGLKKIFHT